MTEAPYDVTARLADRDAQARDGNWLAAAVREGLVAKLAAERPPTITDQLEAILCSGLVGHALLHALYSGFPTVTRTEVYLAVAAAITQLQAEVQLARLDAAIAGMETAA